MDFSKYFKQKESSEGRHDPFCIGADGKPTCDAFMNELTDDDRPATPEVKDMLMKMAIADGYSVADAAYLYG